MTTLEGIFKDAPQLREQIIQERGLREKILSLTMIALACSGLYGFVMGMYHSLWQAISSAVKVPLLFLSTLVICLPTLHFVGLLFGSRVRFLQSLTVLLWGIAVMSVLLSAFAPVACFFWFSGSKYEFMLLMHVVVFAFCGAASLLLIRKNMLALSAFWVPLHSPVREPLVSLQSLPKRARPEPKDAHDEEPAQPDPTEAIEAFENLAPPEAPDNIPRFFLTFWMFLYMFVGTQMAYILSPFLGQSKLFVLLHRGDGNFYTAILQALEGLL